MRQRFNIHIDLNFIRQNFWQCTKNFLFAFIILTLAIIIFFHHTREPLSLPVTVTQLGILLNDKFYRFRDLTSFWIIYEPPFTKHLYLELANSLRPPLAIHLAEQDPVALRQSLLPYLREDLGQKEEPLSDLLWRLLKL